MLGAFLLIVAVWELFMAMIWSSAGALDLFVKLTHLLIGLAGIFFALQQFGYMVKVG